MLVLVNGKYVLFLVSKVEKWKLVFIILYTLMS